MLDALAIMATLMTVLYGISALGRLAPVKRPHYRWRQVAGMSGITLLVLTLAGSAYAVTAVKRSQPSHDVPLSRAGTLTATADALPIGVFAPGEWKSWSPVRQFSQRAGQPVRYVLDYMGQDEPFPAKFGQLAAAHGAEPVLQLMPAMSMANFAAGRDDAYLHRLAQQVRAYRHPVVLSFAPEANGNWYQYGWPHTPPAHYQAAWKHVMAQFSGVSNVTWMDTVNIPYQGSGRLEDYIVPGVMIGIDGYYDNLSGHSFKEVFGSTLAKVRARTQTPVMISETAIRGRAAQAAHVPDLIRSARDNHLAGLIWFNKDKGRGQDWRLTPAGAAALRASLHQA
jgi:hypothetical protein